MATRVEDICNPERFKLDHAIKLARNGAKTVPGFEIAIARHLGSYCTSRSVAISKVFRGLEVLEGVLGRNETDERRLVALIRPFLMSSDPAIASKCVMILGRRSKSLAWLGRILEENDFRIRANLVEALWGRDDPEIRQLLLHALGDSHQRVIANAAYGLFLLEIPEWINGLETLLNSGHAIFRKSGLWLLKRTAVPDASEQVAKFIRDPDPGVKRAAFDALITLRKLERRNEPVAEAPVVEAPVTEAPEAPVAEPPPEAVSTNSYWVPNLLLPDR